MLKCRTVAEGFWFSGYKKQTTLQHLHTSIWIAASFLTDFFLAAQSDLDCNALWHKCHESLRPLANMQGTMQNYYIRTLLMFILVIQTWIFNLDLWVPLCQVWPTKRHISCKVKVVQSGGWDHRRQHSQNFDDSCVHWSAYAWDV